MAIVDVEGGLLRIHITGVDRILAFKSELSIPLEHIRAVSARPEEAIHWFHGLRMPGTSIPGVVTAGTFWTSDGKVFYDVHDAERTIAIDLDHESYHRVILEVDDEPPEQAVTRIEAARAQAAD